MTAANGVTLGKHSLEISAKENENNKRHKIGREGIVAAAVENFDGINHVMSSFPIDLVILTFSYLEVFQIAKISRELNSERFIRKLTKGNAACKEINAKLLSNLLRGYTPEPKSATAAHSTALRVPFAAAANGAAVARARIVAPTIVYSPVLLSQLSCMKSLSLDEIEEYMANGIPLDIVLRTTGKNLELLDLEDSVQNVHEDSDLSPLPRNLPTSFIVQANIVLILSH